MATEERVTLVFSADTKPITKELGKLPGTTAEVADDMAKELNAGFVKMEGQAEQLTGALSNPFQAARGAVTKLTTSFGPLGLAAAAALGAWAIGASKVASAMFELSSDYSTFIDDTLIGAASIGVSAEAFIALERTARAAGGEMAVVEAGLKPMIAGMRDAAKGTGQAAAVFERFGIEVETAEGALRPAEEVLIEVLDAIQTLPTETERAAASMSVFGESGARLTATLGGATDALRANIDEVKDLNLINDEARKQSAAFDESMASLQDTTDTLKLALGEQFIPTINLLIGAMADGLDEAVKYRDVIASIAENTAFAVFFGGFAGAAVDLKDALLEATAEGRELSRNLEDLSEVLPPVISFTSQLATVTDVEAEATTRSAEAHDAQADALRDAADADAVLLASIGARAAAEGAATDIAFEAFLTRKGAIDELAALGARSDLIAIEREANRLQLSEDREGELHALRLQQMAELDTARTEQAALDLARDEETAATKLATQDALAEAAQVGFSILLSSIDQAADAEIATLTALQDELAAGGEDLSELEKSRLESQIAEQRKAAKKLFVISKSLRIGEAIISGLAGATRAFADFPFPASAIIAGSVGALAVANVAQIAAQQPSFHDGRRLSLPTTAPDEVRATLLRGERVLGAQALSNIGGDATVDALNRGEGGRAAPGPQVFQYTHEVFNSFSADNQRLPGSPLWRAENSVLYGRRG